jgi:sterol desaturase/sphingolipid hydroxylase (fatty acid hydroxylase superfamily)
MWLQLASFLGSPLVRLVDPADPFSIWPLYGAFLTALLWYGFARPSRFRRRVNRFVRRAFPRWWWRHPSTVADVRLYVATSLFYASGVMGWLLSVDLVHHDGSAALSALFGPAVTATPSWWIAATAAVAGLVVHDLGYWLAHYLMHRVPVLWEFHKLHHTAEVLTPLTEWRQHPVELVWFPLCSAAITGGWLAVQDQLIGAGATPLGWFGGNGLTLVLVFSLLHLRHTHLWIAATGVWGRIVQSPAHHQIHHSTDPRHHDKNLGLFLSIWDWAFGTLVVPEQRERLRFGIVGEPATPSVWSAWVHPVVWFVRTAFGRLRPVFGRVRREKDQFHSGTMV